MGVWRNISTCGAYLLYVLMVVWMLVQEFLGYTVDWSKSPPSTPSHRRQLAEGSQSKIEKSKIRRVLLDKEEDLEANIAPNTVKVVGDRPEIAPSHERIKEAKTTSYRSISEGCTLPLFYPRQPKDSVQPQSAPTSPSPLQARFGSSSKANPSITGPNTTYRAFNDALSRPQQTGDAILSQRLSFIKRLEYTESHEFHFPSPFPTLCSSPPYTRSPTSCSPKHTLAVLNASIANVNIEAFSKTTSFSTSSSPLSPATPITPDTPISPCPPLSPFITSVSSHSSYSSSYTLESYSPPTDEDIPIHLVHVPSWRCDPERAKFVFGTLAELSRFSDPRFRSDSDMDSSIKEV